MDLDSPEAIDQFVDRFYARLLEDPLLAPLFLEVAAIDLAVHLPHIKAYWQKMLLGAPTYHRLMMARHRAIDRRHAFSAAHYRRWVALFEATLADGFSGPGAERAGRLARRIAGNMRRNLEGQRS